MPAALLALAVPTVAHAATRSVNSSNWAGYAISKPGVRFRRVAGSWVQPAASCAPGARRYSAYWLGIGGFHSTSTALEQIGTQVDCSSLGQAVYSAWYELVPAGPVHVSIPVHPGDEISASVAVSGHTAKLYLANRTTGRVFSERVHAPHVDTTTAEWIVEAPSACDEMGCRPLPLANFGSASFSGAGATTTSGVRGPIAHPAWGMSAITLAPHADRGVGAALTAPVSAAQAAPGPLSAGGDAFTVLYQDIPLAAPAPPPPGPAPEPAPPAIG